MWGGHCARQCLDPERDRRAIDRLASGWRASQHLELEVDYDVSQISFESRGEGLTSHLLSARIRAAWDARLSAEAFAQRRFTLKYTHTFAM